MLWQKIEGRGLPLFRRTCCRLQGNMLHARCILVLKKLKKFKPRPPDMLQTKDGAPITTPNGAEERRMEHFSMVDKAVIVDTISLARIISLAQGAFGTTPRTVAVLPTRAEIEILFTKAKTGHSPGEDGIVGEALRAAPIIWPIWCTHCS